MMKRRMILKKSNHDTIREGRFIKNDECKNKIMKKMTLHDWKGRIHENYRSEEP
jgi:hypothetical protein